MNYAQTLPNKVGLVQEVEKCTAPVGEGDLCVHFKEDKNLMAEWEDSPLQITGYMSENTFS